MLQNVSVKTNNRMSLSQKCSQVREVKLVAKDLLHFLFVASVVIGMWVITKQN